MNLHGLSKLNCSQPAKTHAERLMVLAQVSSETMPTFLKTLETKDPTPGFVPSWRSARST